VGTSAEEDVGGDRPGGSPTIASSGAGAGLKKIGLLTPRSGMSLERFTTHWRGTHGPLVSGSPGYDAYRRRYLQNHVISPGPLGRVFPYAGMAELWVAGGKRTADAFGATSIYLDRIRPDEQRFLDMERSIAASAEEVPVVTGHGAVKLIVLAARKPELGHADYVERLRGHAGLVTDQSDFSSRLRGYTQNHVVEGSPITLNGAPASGLTLDSIEAFWFDSVADMDAALDTPGYKERILPERASLMADDRLVSFLAREIVFFDNGALVLPPPYS
jgi:uncharacterized protein (TIGR02118 family)